MKGIYILWCWIVGHNYGVTGGDYEMCWRCGKVIKKARGK